MIPIRDTTPSRNVPVVNTALIGINVLVFMYELALGPDLDRALYIYGLVPARYTVDHLAAYFSFGQQAFSFLSFMFLHGGFLHLLGNMWSLYIFGDNVEDHLGPLRYLVFYLLCGLTSGFSHLLVNPHSNVPTIGASGAIAGVMGAYFLLYPNARILTLIPIFIFPWFVEIPAYFFLGLWFVLQLLNAAGSHGAISGVAWWAHVGGFVFGMVFLKVFTLLPSTGMTDRMRKVTARRRTHRLQIIRPTAAEADPNLYGTIIISPYEALVGTRKLVNVPGSGLQRRVIRVNVPPGVSGGQVLRLKGMGKTMPDGGRGDLLLKVIVQ